MRRGEATNDVMKEVLEKAGGLEKEPRGRGGEDRDHVLESQLGVVVVLVVTMAGLRDPSGGSGWNFFFEGTLVAPKTIAATITAEVMAAVGTGNAQFRDGV